MSLKKYKIIDITILCVIGIIVEALGIYVFNQMINATIIATAVSLLIILIAVTRWKWTGLVVSPLVPIATIIMGRFFNYHDAYSEYYTWQLYVAIVFSLVFAGVIAGLWYKKITPKETFKSIALTLGLYGCLVLGFHLMLSTIYLILERRFIYFSSIIWNAFGYVILLVGTFILNKQDIFQDVKQSLIEAREIQEIEDDFEFNFDDEEEAEFNEEKGVLENEQDY